MMGGELPVQRSGVFLAELTSSCISIAPSYISRTLPVGPISCHCNHNACQIRGTEVIIEMKGLDLAVGLGLGLVIGRLIWGRRTKRAKVSSTPSAARIVLLGDSITQFSFSESGFGARIAERYQRRADVCVRGYSGYNTRWIKEILPNLHDNDTITKLVVIFFGANDASIAALNPRQHVPIEEFRENLLVIANTIRAQCTSTHILFVTPPPIDEPTYLKQRFAGDPPALSRTNAQAGAYAAAVIEIASELRAPCVDIWTSMQFAAPDGKKFRFATSLCSLFLLTAKRYFYFTPQQH